jgi:hypothetical protein
MIAATPDATMAVSAIDQRNPLVPPKADFRPAPTMPSAGPRRLRSNSARLLAGVAVAVVGVVGLAVPLASAQGASTKISLVATEQKDLNLPAGGVEVDSIKNSAGKTVGSGTLICTNNGPKKAPRCIATITLPAGDIVSVLIPKNSPTTGGPIIGGTGRYAKVIGTVFGRTISATKSDLVITVKH